MVPVEALATKTYDGEDGEDAEGNDFLYDLELHERVGTTVALKTDAIGRHLKAVFEEGEAPRDEDDDEERCFALQNADILQFEMAIPSENHENVAHNEEHDGENVLHCEFLSSLVFKFLW